MPRTGRGGRRQGQPGKAYPNRTDLRAQPVRSAPSKTYGDGVASERAQSAVPLPQTAGAGAPAGLEAALAPAGPLPGDQPIARPTDRPNEPLTAGMSIGAGPGPSAVMPSVDPVVENLRAAARAFPNPSIFALLEAVDR